jgi:diguanylate cyclase (GGDEF)-like protein
MLQAGTVVSSRSICRAVAARGEIALRRQLAPGHQLCSWLLLAAAALLLTSATPTPAQHFRQYPATPIGSIIQPRRTLDASRLVHVRGTITFYHGGESAVIENEGKSISLEIRNLDTRNDAGISVGDVVDALGYVSDREDAPILRQASIEKTGIREPVVPQVVNFAQASSEPFDDDLVSITGSLVSQYDDGNRHTLVIKVDGHQVSSQLDSPEPVRKYPVGSRLQLTGICRVVTGEAERHTSLSHLDLRSANDVQLLLLPPWLTVERMVEISGVLVILVLALSIRLAFVRLRAANQNAWHSRSTIVARERSRILELISSNSTLDEVLTEICKTTRDLLPGAECSYNLGLESKKARDLKQTPEAKQSESQPGAKPQSDTGFEVALVDSESKTIGSIVLSLKDCKATPHDRTETQALLAELAALAMRQSLLFRGLVHHSNHDPLTGLPNRRLSEERLTKALEEAEANNGQLAVIYIDINRFKFVNDTYGHSTGDLYLQQIAGRLKSQLRSIDMLARIGGDEFVVIAPFAEGIDRAYALTARLQACFDDPFDLKVASLDGSASFGFARYPEHGKTIAELTEHADQEMYLAKESEARNAEAQSIGIISTDELENALTNNRFRLAYQPQFSIAGRLTCLEALIRLDDPVLGMITPDAFISVAERHPVIVDIGDWVLSSALQDAVRWQLDTGEPVLLAINVAVRQLEDPNYARSVLDRLKANNFPPDRLEIELVERSLMSTGDNVAKQLKQLRDAGVRIALDDFGTGQSCLSILHKMPIDTIKLDRRFIHAMDNEPKVLPIIQAIVSMAHSLGKRVVAEAIEHVGPVPALLAMGAMDFQGDLLSRPIPADDVYTFLRTMRSGIVMPGAFRTASRERVNSAPTSAAD